VSRASFFLFFCVKPGRLCSNNYDLE
jgi:hypothetical protein